MTDEIKLSVDIRKDFSGSRLNELRQQEKIPAVLYGPEIESTSIVIDEKEFKSVISTEHGENVLIKLKVANKKPLTTLIKEIQIHPVTMKIIHVDMCQINLSEEIEVEVPLEVEGASPGVATDGGVLEHIIRSVKVKCLPTKIPDKLVLNVSNLEIGSGLKIKDILEIEGIEILDDEDALAVNVVQPSEYKEPEEEEEKEELEKEGEPEVIGQKEKEGKVEEKEEPAK